MSTLSLGSYTYNITSPTTMIITNNQRIKRIPICNILVDLTFTSINTNNVYPRTNIPYKVNRSKDDPELIESITIFMYDLIRATTFTKEARQFLGVSIEPDRTNQQYIGKTVTTESTRAVPCHNSRGLKLDSPDVY